MARKLRVFLAVLATTLGLMVPTATSASASGNEWLGCAVSGGVWYYTSPCNGGLNYGPVIVEFQIMDMTYPSTVSWAVPAAYVTKISSGCTSADTFCHFSVSKGSQEITVSVTLTQNGASKTLTTSASVEPMCGDAWC